MTFRDLPVGARFRWAAEDDLRRGPCIKHTPHDFRHDPPRTWTGVAFDDRGPQTYPLVYIATDLHAPIIEEHRP